MSKKEQHNQNQSKVVIEIEHLYNRFGDFSVHEDLNLTINQGELVALVGGSGSGKTTLLRAIIMLLKPYSGQVYLLGEPIWGIGDKAQNKLKSQFGMLFQSGALFSSMTVLENVMVPMQEHLNLSKKEMIELAYLKIALAGLPLNAANRLPKELSGGMVKRAALARALALDPAVLFLDEPTAGLDPVSAGEFDALMVQLKESLSLTIVMVTHDLDSLWAITDKIAFLGEKKIIAYEPIEQLVHNKHPLIQKYFQGPRGRMVEDSYGK